MASAVECGERFLDVGTVAKKTFSESTSYQPTPDPSKEGNYVGGRGVLKLPSAEGRGWVSRFWSFFAITPQTLPMRVGAARAGEVFCAWF